MIEFFASFRISGMAAWMLAVATVIVLLESRRLALLRHTKPIDNSVRQHSRAVGWRVGILGRFFVFTSLAILFPLETRYAGWILAAVLIWSALPNARDFALGFAEGVAKETDNEPSTPLIAPSAAAYLAFGRGALAFFVVLGSRPTAA